MRRRSAPELLANNDGTSITRSNTPAAGSSAPTETSSADEMVTLACTLIRVRNGAGSAEHSRENVSRKNLAAVCGKPEPETTFYTKRAPDAASPFCQLAMLMVNYGVPVNELAPGVLDLYRSTETDQPGCPMLYVVTIIDEEVYPAGY